MSKGKISRAAHRLRGLVKKYRKTKGRHTMSKIRSTASYIRNQRLVGLARRGLIGR